MLRRPLAALFIALLVAGALPTPALAAIPIASAVNTATAEEVPVTITLTGGDLDLHDITAFDVTSGPAHGSLGSIGPISCPVETPGICLADVTYTSEAGWWGTDEFLYTATGQDGTSVPGLASILVAQLNDAPSFTVGTDVTVDEDSGAYSQPWATSISPGDPYEVAQHLTWDLQATNLDLFVTAPQLAPDGTLEFEARPDWSGSSTVTVRLKDDGGTDTWSVPGAVASDTSAQETFVITVVPVNDAPTPSGFSTSLPWGIRWLLGSLSATDIDGDDTTTFTVVTPPAHGDLELLGPIVCSGSVARDCSASAIFTADPGYVGPDSFTYTTTDGVTVSTPATVLITVTDNTAPVCDDQSAEADEDGSSGGTISCTDLDGEEMTYALVDGAGHGVATVSPTGSWTYVPAANFHGTDAFTFTATDANATSNTAAVTIAVASQNDAPVCTGDVSSGPEDTDQTGTIDTCSDVDSDPLTYAKASDPTHGSVTVASNGSWTYTPAKDYAGPDGFSFTASDATIDSTPAVIALTITPVDDAPVCGDATTSVSEDGSVSGTLACADAEDEELAYSLVAGATHAAILVVAPDGSWSYQPESNFNGDDSFTFQATDAHGTSNVATMTITVGPVNDAPTASDQPVTTTEDTAKGITLGANDIDGDTLSYAIVDQPAHGVLSGTGASPTYTPNQDFNGTDSFTFRVHDGTVNSNTATVSITVTAVNDRPVATGQSPTTPEDTALPITLAGTDIEGSPLVYTVVGQPAHGDLSGTGASLTYTPDQDYNGADSFTFKVNDGTIDSLAVATVSITVTAVNDLPIATAQSNLQTSEDTGLPITLAGTDVENSTLTYTVVTAPAHGALMPGTGAARTYTPAQDYHGADSFTFKVNDGQADSAATATVSIVISPVNDAPVCQSVTPAPGAEDQSQSGWVVCADVDGDTLTYSVVTPAQHGTAAFGTGPAWTYTPAQDYHGADAFSFRANDGHATSNTATVTAADSAPASVTITVTDVNDPPDARTDVSGLSGFPYVLATRTTTLNVLGNDSAGAGDSGVFGAVTVDAVGSPLAPTRGTASRATSGTGVVYDPRACSVGDDSFSYVIKDGGDGTDGATVVPTIVRPGEHGFSVKPVVDTPSVGLRTGAAIGSAVPLRLAWCGVTKSGASVTSYRLEQSSNAGATWPTVLSSTSRATSFNRGIGTSATYQWRVRMTASGGTGTGAYAVSPTAKAAIAQESSATIRYAGSWGTKASSKASGGRMRYSSSTKASATIAVPAGVRQVGIVGPKGSGYGRFKVWVDGTYVGTISERSSTASNKLILSVRSLNPLAPHTIKLMPASTARVYLDAVVTLR